MSYKCCILSASLQVLYPDIRHKYKYIQIKIVIIIIITEFTYLKNMLAKVEGTVKDSILIRTGI